MTNPTNSKPWYRQLWPWMLMIPPAAAMIGGAITLYLALSRPHELVRDDCYRDGVTMSCGSEDVAEKGAAKNEGASPPGQ